MQADQARIMASYNRWMNQKVYAVCEELTDDERKADSGAFFHSIHGTLNHLLLGDKVWLGRFIGRPYVAKSLDQELYSSFAELRSEREKTDAEIERWAAAITDEDLAGKLEFTSIVDRKTHSYDLWLCVTHFFNHQTHHRGQLTTLLSQAGKDYGVTDLLWLPEAMAR